MMLQTSFCDRMIWSKRYLPDSLSKLSRRSQWPQRNVNAKTGTGDVYGNVLDFGPAGKLFHIINAASSGLMSCLDNLVPSARPGTAIQGFFGVKLIINALVATRDRRI